MACKTACQSEQNNKIQHSFHESNETDDSAKSFKVGDERVNEVGRGR